MSIKWRPLHEIEEFVQDIEPYWGSAWDLAADVYEDEGNVVIEMYLPGVSQDNITLDAEEEYVRIAVEREESEEKEGKQFFKKEIRCGSFERVIDLPHAIDPEKAVAHFSEGILTVVLPRKESKKSRSIKVEKK